MLIMNPYQHVFVICRIEKLPCHLQDFFCRYF